MTIDRKTDVAQMTQKQVSQPEQVVQFSTQDMQNVLNLLGAISVKGQDVMNLSAVMNILLTKGEVKSV